MADLDGDGHADVFSGSYSPGDIYWFRGAGNGTWQKGEILKDAEGEHVNAGPPWKSRKEPEMDSLAASPWLVDFDGDGDLDLLVGNIAGHVVLISNEGTPQEPSFVRKHRLQADGADIRVGGGDAGPTTADWDGDAKWDLLVGSGDGAVLWYRNTGSTSAPAFARGVALVPKRDGSWSIPHDRDPARSQHRAKVYCTDWNQDGRLDLLVGDYASIEMPEPQLTDAQQRRRDELRKRRNETSWKMGPLWKKQAEEKMSDDDRALLGELQKEMNEIAEQLRPLERENKSTGWVWVYLRRAPERRVPR